MSSQAPTPRNAGTPNLSLNQQIILDEDEYTEGLSKIIARDFFPTLNHLTATNDYLSALESQDAVRINDSVRTLRELGPTPIVRPGFDQMQTPIRSRSQSGPNKRRRIEDDMSVDEYQARFTSEDNASFTEILDDENKQRRKMYKWAWEAQAKAMEGKMIENGNRERMLLEGGESDSRGVGVRPGVKGRIAIERPDVLLITQGEEKEKDEIDEEKEDTNSETLVVAKSAGEDVMAHTADSRTPYVSTWKFKTRNGLMFSPDADDSPYHLSENAIIQGHVAQSEGVVFPKLISHANTRLPSPPPEAASTIPPSPTRSRIDAAISGMAYKASQEEGAAGTNGYNYVPTLPSPSPDQLGPAALKELMTTGKLLATPRLLSSTRDGDEMLNPEATPFHIAPPSRREQTGLKLSMKAGRSIREKAALLNGTARTPMTSRGKGDMAPPSMTPRKSASELTPAARALLARSTGAKADGTPLRTASSGLFDREREGAERDLRKVKWTPSPMTRR